MVGDAWSAHSPRPWFERLGDLGVACGLVVLTLPLMIAVAIAIKCGSHGPITVWKKRTSLNGRQFWALQFRSTAHEPGASSYSEPKVTFVGRIIRTLRIDLLPQLVNVLRGEMTCRSIDPVRLFFLE